MAALKQLQDWVKGSDMDEEYNESGDMLNETSEFETYTGPNSFEADPSMSLDFGNRPSQMVVFEPRAYSESQGIADHLKGGRGCIINLHRVNKDQAKRIIDFLSGVVYAIEGDVQKIGPNVFLTTPSNFGVYGEISQVED